MEREHIEAYLNRPWSVVARKKERFWARQKAEMSLTEVFHLMDDLREHARRLHPDWPSEAEQREDWATHQRVSEALRSVRVESRG